MSQITFTVESAVEDFVRESSSRKKISLSKEVNHQLKFAMRFHKGGYEKHMVKFGNYLFSEERKEKLLEEGISEDRLEERMKIITPLDVAHFDEKV